LVEEIGHSTMTSLALSRRCHASESEPSFPWSRLSDRWLEVLHQRFAMSRMAAKRPEDHDLEGTGKKFPRIGVGHGPSDKKQRANQ
jgi:hypothetical protein